MKFNFLVVILCFVVFSGVVSALGCCVSPGYERCYSSTQEDACFEMGGNFYPEDASCSSIRSCAMGCCIIGLDASMMTMGKCQAETKAAGFAVINFMQTTESCEKYVSSRDWGACLTKDTYGEKTCFYLTREQCLGEFQQGVLCSSVLNTVCNKTNNSVCYNNDVYYIDSCGNRDSLKESCKEGVVCRQTEFANAISASCNSVDCVDSFNFNSFVVGGSYVTKPVYSNPIQRKNGDVWCVTNGMVPYENKYFDEGKKDFFEMFFSPNSLVANDSASSLVGNRFFSRYCSNGDIFTEPCDDLKEGYCNGAGSLYTNSSDGTGGQCDSNEWRLCLSAESEDECDQVYCEWYDPSEGLVINKQMVVDLNLGKCLPKVPGGLVVDGSKDSICSEGDFASTLEFGFFDEASAYLVKDAKSMYGNAGLLLEGQQNWYPYTSTQLVVSQTTGQNMYVGESGFVPLIYWGSMYYLPLNPQIISYLDYRCSRIADCTGKANWVGVKGGDVDDGLDWVFDPKVLANFSVSGYEGLPVIYVDISQTALGGNYDAKMNFQFKYECNSYKAPKNGTCKMCMSDSTPCTEYKCESLGSNCEYHEINNGFSGGECMERTDFTPPQITMNCPLSSSIKPQEPIKISATTSESAFCRFSIGDAKASYDLMPYNLGAIWGKSHETVLTVPGMNKIKNGNITQYPLLTSSGTYNVYTRCVDPAGNGDTTPAQLCSFEVPKTPDKNQPVILKFNPVSGSAVAYNSSSKSVKLLVNEPTECRWELKDVDYSSMNHSFSCINKLVMYEDVSGFECFGDLSVNFTNKSVGSLINYYIRCKDQPGLNETGEYKRNANTQSSVYSLKSSDKLEIEGMGNKSRLILGYGASNWTLSIKTRGGGYNGEAVCKWRLSFRNQTTAFSEFMNTGGTVHTQTMTSIAEGDYVLDVKCSDKASNNANLSIPLEIRYDLGEPAISRVYNNNGNVVLNTIEPAVCKFTNTLALSVGCYFPFSDPNLTTMTGATNLQHMTSLKKGLSYFIKCQDFYGNENSYCGMIAKFI